MGFDAGKAVEPLDFTFVAFGGPEGVIAEPTTAQVNDFFTEVQVMAAKLSSVFGGKNPKDIDPEEAAAALADLGDDVMSEYTDGISHAIDRLCGGDGADKPGFPSTADINALPYRIQSAFMQWIVGQIRPEQRASATNG